MPGLALLQFHDAINLSLSSANSCLAAWEKQKKWRKSSAVFVHSPGRFEWENMSFFSPEFVFMLGSLCKVVSAACSNKQ